MFNFKEPQSAKRVVEPKELKSKVHEQVLLVADMRRPPGRPKHSVLGDERTQVTIEVVSRIVNLVVDAYSAEDAVLHETLDKLYTTGGRRDYARDVIYTLAKQRRGVVSDIPAEALYQSLGQLIRVGKAPSDLPGQRPLGCYIYRDSATPVELSVVWNSKRKKAAEATARFSEDTDLFAAVVPAMPAGMTLAEFRAQQSAAYHAQQVERAPQPRKSKLAQ